MKHRYFYLYFLKNCLNKDLYGLRIKSESIINECANDYKETEDDIIII